MNTNPTPTTAPLIDTEQLQAACDGDIVLLRELMDMYFGQADQILSGLLRALQNRSTKEVDHLAHKLAGSSLACGLSAIVAPLRTMEINAKGGKLDGAEGLLAEAVTTLELLRKAVQDYLQQKQAA